MKATEKAQALALRLEGCSIKDISKRLGVAKSSVSIWVRHVELTDIQKNYLRKKGLLREEVERRRQTRLKNEKLKRDVFINAAQATIPKITDQQLWLMGVMLYWGEGGKTRRIVRFSNSDPNMIKIIMRFFREVCEVPDEKFRGYIHIHPHLDYQKAESYWSTVSGIPLHKLYKTYRIPSKSSLGRKDSLPNGTFDVYVLDTLLFYKIVGWTRGVSGRLLDEPLLGFGTDEKI